jgi:UDP-hydrolysing UDP-N-acetyl-D-glucosamine 2-epimerase
MKKRTIAYVSGTRADFGLMTGILRAIEAHPKLGLHVYAMGMHLMPKFGYTYDEVRRVFQHTKKIHATIRSDSRVAMSRYLADCVTSVTSEFSRNRPDVALVLGDRTEMLAVACACMYLGIPVAHIHGGDVSGTIDDVVRDVITKLSSIHFPATSAAAKRLRSLGVDRDRMYVVGSPSLDAIVHWQHRMQKQRYILLLLHPENESRAQNLRNVRIVLSALEHFHVPLIIIYPNADPGGSAIIGEIEKQRRNPLITIFRSIPYEKFLSVAGRASVWVGNSSAGIIESPSLQVPVVNLGDRQKGRIRGANVIDVPFDKHLIRRAVEKSLTNTAYLRKISRIRNPWGDGKTAQRIVKILASHKI